MAALGLGDIERFPFVEPPELRNIRDGINLLVELDAIDPRHENTRKWLTSIGRTLARLPVDPRFGRMVVEANEAGCLHEVIIITAAMSVQDPRERPTEKREAAGMMHARFNEPGSDFITWLNLWNHLEHERKARSGNQFAQVVSPGVPQRQSHPGMAGHRPPAPAGRSLDEMEGRKQPTVP